MTRHGKNCTNAAFYSYHERQRDAKTSGFGTLQERLGADSIKEFDCCSLTLQPCKDPVITPNGYLFEREAVLQYILDKKKEIAKSMKAYEKHVSETLTKQQQDDIAAQKLKEEKFDAVEGTPARPGALAQKRVAEIMAGVVGGFDEITDGPSTAKNPRVEQHLSNMSGDKAKSLPSFWIPELNPTASATAIEKPQQKVLCPLSGKVLKVKDLMPVVFTPVNSESIAGGARVATSKQARYMCPITHDALTNSTRCAYLKSSKRVVKWECVEMIKKDMVDPITGDPLKDDDIIELQRGGTGFAATNKDQLKAKLYRPQLELQ